MACTTDAAAFQATERVRSELHQPDRWLHWSPYEEILGAIVEPSVADWKDNFRTRYLDFAPVLHLLADDDPRRGKAEDRR